MTVQFRAELLERYIAPGITKFSQAEIPDLRQLHTQNPFWLTNHFLDSALTASFKPPCASTPTTPYTAPSPPSTTTMRLECLHCNNLNIRFPIIPR